MPLTRASEGPRAPAACGTAPAWSIASCLEWSCLEWSGLDGAGLEQPWTLVVDAFRIEGGCGAAVDAVLHQCAQLGKGVAGKSVVFPQGIVIGRHRALSVVGR